MRHALDELMSRVVGVLLPLEAKAPTVIAPYVQFAYNKYIDINTNSI